MAVTRPSERLRLALKQLCRFEPRNGPQLMLKWLSLPVDCRQHKTLSDATNRRGLRKNESSYS